MDPFASSELILNEDGSIYHLKLFPEQISDIIFLVGDPDRVSRISSHFDKIDHREQKREFITHTGWYKGVRLSAISTGIGTDNIDIVVNELDALANIDLSARKIKGEHRQLTLVRLGTSGALIPDISPGSLVVSAYAIGLDGLMQYYERNNDETGIRLGDTFLAYCDQENIPVPLRPYGARGTLSLAHRYFADWTTGITLTASGFYAPQSRQLRAAPRTVRLIDRISGFTFEGFRVTNMEMETAAIYGLAAELGHRALSINTILANRASGQFARDPRAAVDNMIIEVLERLTRQP